MNVRKIASLRSIARRKFMQVCAGSLALAAAGCGRGKDRAYSRGSTVTVGYRGEDALNPGENPQLLVFLPLLAGNEQGELEGRLAKSWQHSPDYHEWTYHLRTDVRWHDGRPVTANDVQFALELLSHPDVPEAGPFESIRVLDEATIRVRANRPHHNWVGAYPKHLLAHLDPKKFYHWDFWTHPVGNGPYRFLRYLPETMIEFEANPDYHGKRPRIERVVLKFVAHEAGLSELLAGNVDTIAGEEQPAGSTQVLRLAADSRFQAHHWYRGRVAQALLWNNEHPFFRDPRVRRALTLAVNRRELLRLANHPEFVPVVDGPYSIRQLHRRDLPEPLPYDSTQARALLDAAGWHDRNGAGMRERDGQAFRFTALVLGQANLIEKGVYIKEQLRRIGVTMEVQTLPYGNLRVRMKAGLFDAALMSQSNSYFGLKEHFGERPLTGYTSGEVLKLIHRLQTAADPDLEDNTYRKITELFQQDVPATYLSPTVETVIAHRRLRGLRSPWRADPVRYMEDLWLEDGIQQ